LLEFRDLTSRVLNFLPNVITSTEERRGYRINASSNAGTTKYIRPIKHELFISNISDFQREYDGAMNILSQLRAGEREFGEPAYTVIDKVFYTIQQSIGAGLDLLVDPNSCRKHVGNRFEELIRLTVTALGVANKKVVFKIPYDTDEGQKTYSCETDLVFSPFDKVRSTSASLDSSEVVVSLKITSKDRMSKIFTDKRLLEGFVQKKIKHVGIFFNDVQRKKSKDISYTFVPGLFLVYTKFLDAMDGIYYIDPPPRSLNPPHNRYIFTFSRFLIKDIWVLISPSA